MLMECVLDEHADHLSFRSVASRLSIPFWVAPIGKGEPFDVDFKAHFLLAIFSRVRMRGEIALHEQQCTFGNRPLNSFCLVAPGITVQPDGDVLYAALRVDSEREHSMRHAVFCYF